MKMWIARDINNQLFAYTLKPTTHHKGYWEMPDDCRVYSIDNTFFTEVTFENSPQEVELKLASNENN